MSGSPVFDLLARVRARARLARVAAVLPWAVVAGALTHTAAHLSGAPAATSWTAGLAVAAACAALVPLAWGLLRPLTPRRVARLIDERTEQQDRFSTAVEVGPTAGLLAAALHRDVARRAARIGAGDVVTLRWPRVAPAALAAALGVAVAAQALVPAGTPARRAGLAGDAVTVERLEALAELAAEAAEARRDPHMAAVANALAELAEEAAARGEREVSDVTKLSELVRALDRLVAPRGSLTTPTALASANRTDVPLNETLSALEERLTRISALTGQGEYSDYYDPETTWLEGDRMRQGPTLGDAPDVTRPDNVAGAEAAAGLENAPVQAGDEGPIDAASAFIIGASSTSTSGASSMAGEGTEELFGDADAAVQAPGIETVGVQGTESEDGRRISVEVSPDAADATDAGGSYETATWRPNGLPQVAVRSLPLRYRSVAGAYFLPPQETVSR